MSAPAWPLQSGPAGAAEGRPAGDAPAADATAAERFVLARRGLPLPGAAASVLTARWLPPALRSRAVPLARARSSERPPAQPDPFNGFEAIEAAVPAPGSRLPVLPADAAPAASPRAGDPGVPPPPVERPVLLTTVVRTVEREADSGSPRADTHPEAAATPPFTPASGPGAAPPRPGAPASPPARAAEGVASSFPAQTRVAAPGAVLTGQGLRPPGAPVSPHERPVVETRSVPRGETPQPGRGESPEPGPARSVTGSRVAPTPPQRPPPAVAVGEAAMGLPAAARPRAAPVAAPSLPARMAAALHAPAAAGQGPAAGPAVHIERIDVAVQAAPPVRPVANAPSSGAAAVPRPAAAAPYRNPWASAYVRRD